MRVDQVIPMLASRDAIGVHTMTLTDALRRAGIDSDIYYGEVAPEVAGRGRPLAQLGRAQKDRWLLYQSSIGSPVFEMMAARPEPKLVNYHNITPARLVEAWEPQVGYEASLGRSQLERLADGCPLAVADSAYNEAELVAAGYEHTAVVSLLIDMTTTGAAPDRAVAARLAETKARGGANLLFVGKVAPHKAPHDLIKMLAVYRRLYDPEARLHLVGGFFGQYYRSALEAFAADAGLGEAVSMPGSVTPAAMEAYYRGADAFVCASDHEGFCVPIVEAMGRGLPVVAYAATAVPETVGDAGILLPTKEPLVFAAAVAKVIEDGTLRARLAGATARRVAHYAVGPASDRFVALVRSAIGA